MARHNKAPTDRRVRRGDAALGDGKPLGTDLTLQLLGIASVVSRSFCKEHQSLDPRYNKTPADALNAGAMLSRQLQTLA